MIVSVTVGRSYGNPSVHLVETLYRGPGSLAITLLAPTPLLDSSSMASWVPTAAGLWDTGSMHGTLWHKSISTRHERLVVCLKKLSIMWGWGWGRGWGRGVRTAVTPGSGVEWNWQWQRKTHLLGDWAEDCLLGPHVIPIMRHQVAGWFVSYSMTCADDWFALQELCFLPARTSHYYWVRAMYRFVFCVNLNT